MKYLLLSLLTLFLAIAIGSIVVKDAGYVLLTISGWKIETSAVLFFIALFYTKNKELSFVFLPKRYILLF